MNMQQTNASRKSRKLAGILADLKGNKCEHCDYDNILKHLNKTIKLHPDYVLTEEENAELYHLYNRILIEEKKNHPTLNAPCVICGFGPKHKRDIKKAISEIIKVLDEALKLPTLTCDAFLRLFST